MVGSRYRECNGPNYAMECIILRLAKPAYDLIYNLCNAF